MSQPAYLSVADYCRATKARKGSVGKALGLSRFRFSAVLYPDRYPVALTDAEVGRIAALLNQSFEFVAAIYRRRAA